jgi:type I restriction enzyme S subunit
MRGPLHDAQVSKWLNVGAVFDSLNVRDLPRFEVPIPPLPEQRAIAHMLGTLDDKIELNRQMNQTLEQIAAALFKSWFVDFDPVRAKAEGRQPEGMDAATAALFPDQLVESEIGEIPEGWRVGRLEDLAHAARSYLNPLDYPNESFSHYSLPAFDAGRMPIAEMGSAIKSSKLVVPDGAVLISKLNPHTPRVWLPADPGSLRRLASTEFLVTQPHDPVHLPFLYALVISAEFTQRMQGMVTGTTGSRQRVPPSAVLGMTLVMPPSRLIEAYSNLMGPVYQQVLANLEQAATLAQLRDTLLPRLLSGELRVQTDVLNQETVSVRTDREPVLVQSRF